MPKYTYKRLDEKHVEMRGGPCKYMHSVLTREKIITCIHVIDSNVATYKSQRAFRNHRNAYLKALSILDNEPSAISPLILFLVVSIASSIALILTLWHLR